MRNPLFDVAENKHKRANELEFEIGDTVKVTMRIVEGGKEKTPVTDEVVGAAMSGMFR